MAISMFKCTCRSELQGTPSKLTLHAIPKQDWNTVLYKARTNDHNKPIRNHNPTSAIRLPLQPYPPQNNPPTKQFNSQRGMGTGSVVGGYLGVSGGQVGGFHSGGVCLTQVRGVGG